MSAVAQLVERRSGFQWVSMLNPKLKGHGVSSILTRTLQFIFIRFFCLHLQYEEVHMPPPDWRTDTRFYRCCKCGGFKNVGFNGVAPIQFRYPR